MIGRSGVKPLLLRWRATSKMVRSARSTSSVTSSTSPYAEPAISDRGFDQAAQDAFFLNDLGVVNDIRRGELNIAQLHQVADAADAVEDAAPLEFVLERDDIDRLVLFGQRDHAVVDVRVGVAVEVVAGKDFGRAFDRAAIAEEHRAQYRHLGFQIVRRYSA